MINRVAILLLSLLILTGCTTDNSKNSNSQTDDKVKQEWSDWIKNNHSPIASCTSDDFSDLGFLATVLNNRDIVQLGESGHGVKEFNQMKVRLIKYLHQNLGYSVIAFESSIFACHRAYRTIDKYSHEDLMRRSIFGVWYTDEVIELFKYIKETQNSSNPLILTGFDTQISGSADKERPHYLKELIRTVDSDYADEVYQKDYEFMNYSKQHGYNKYTEWVKENQQSLETFYLNLNKFLEDNRDRLIQGDVSAVDMDILIQSAWATSKFVIQIASEGEFRYATRDKGMADNFTFLKNSIYKNRKIMVWAHNFHIRHNQPSIVGDVLKVKTMGYWLNQRFKDSLYTIELYMYQGKAADNGKNIYDIQPHQARSLEKILNETGLDYVFSDLLNQKQVEGNSWMFEQIYAKSWGTRDMQFNPSTQFNGVILIKTVNPPSYYSFSGRSAEYTLPEDLNRE